jgi:hypothetical protein
MVNLLHGSCHCGAVQLALPQPPQEVIDCNCSICRRIAALWALYPAGAVRIDGHPQQTCDYIWGQKTIRTVRCRHCGCVTHWEPLQPGADAKSGINLRNFEAAAIAQARVRRFDGAVSWDFVDQ